MTSLSARLDSGAVFSTFPSRVDLTSTRFGASWSPISSLSFEASYGGTMAFGASAAGALSSLRQGYIQAIASVIAR
jgi:hypothetical protein